MLTLLKISLPYFIAFFLGCYVSSILFMGKVNQLKLNFVIAQKAQVEANHQLLQQSMEDNEKLTRLLLARQHELTQTQRMLQGNIADAVEKDTDAYTGMGDNSLQLYKQAFGYNTEN